MATRKQTFGFTGKIPLNKVSFLTADIRFNLKNRRKIREWIIRSVGLVNKKTGEISYIFCSDNFLLDLNRDYLNHDTLTDVISFGLSDDPGILSGEIYISVPRVRENAVLFMQTAEDELHRVMIHGVLHLAGYTDNNNAEKKAMRELEQRYLDNYHGIK